METTNYPTFDEAREAHCGLVGTLYPVEAYRSNDTYCAYVQYADKAYIAYALARVGDQSGSDAARALSRAAHERYLSALRAAESGAVPVA